MKKSIWKKQLPTIMGIGILVVALGVGVFVFTLGGGLGEFAPRATPQTTPKKIKITNVTDTGFTISFFTDEKTPGFVKYGTEQNALKSQASDDRDQLSGTIGSYSVHHVTVRGLQPNTNYYYVLGTGSNASFDNNGSPFTIKTAQRNGAPSAAKTAYGNILKQDGTPAEGAVVYVTIEGVGEMSSLVKKTSSWAIPLSNARLADGSGYAQLSDDQSMLVTVQGTTATDTASYTTTIAESQPVANITLGPGGGTVAEVPEAPSMEQDTQVVDDETGAALMGTQQTEQGPDSLNGDQGSDGVAQIDQSDQLDNELSSDQNYMTQDEASPSGDSDLLAMVDETSEEDPAASLSAEEKTVFLNNPDDQQTVKTSKPIIKGQAIPNVVVTIEVNSDTQVTQELTTNENGEYQLDMEQLQEELEPGEHTITVSYIDPETGQIVTEEKTFYVDEPINNTSADTSYDSYDQNSYQSYQDDSYQLAEAETGPYGTGNPYPAGGTPTPTPTTTSYSSGSATSSYSGRTTMPATNSSIPVSGSVHTTMVLLIGGFFFITAGVWSFWIAHELKETQ